MALEIITGIAALPRLPRTKAEGQEKLAERVEVLEKFIENLVRILEDRDRVKTTAINLQIQMSDVGVFYFQLPDANGSWSDEDVRLKKVSNGDIELQEYDGSAWRSGTSATAVWGF